MNGLQIYTPGALSEIQSIGKAMAESGFFPDTQTAAKAVVKIVAGAELGLPPFAAMTGIHIIKGKATLGANLIATLIKNDPRYNYKVTHHTDDAAAIDFYEDGEKVGTSEYSIKDAQAAGLMSNPNWKKYPKNMLFARAISNGAKWYAAGVFGGAPVYTPDELDGTVQYDADGDIVAGSYVETGKDPFVDDFLDIDPTPEEIQARTQFEEVGQLVYGEDWEGKRNGIIAYARNNLSLTGYKRYLGSTLKHLTEDQILAVIEEMESRAEIN